LYLSGFLIEGDECSSPFFYGKPGQVIKDQIPFLPAHPNHLKATNYYNLFAVKRREKE